MGKKDSADVSHWKRVTNFLLAKENCSFLISKATQGCPSAGTAFIDSTLDEFIQGCEDNGIPYWLYTYLDAGNEVAQTQYMIDVCKDKVGDYFVGYALDVEAGNSASNVQKALKYLESVSGKCLLYTMTSQHSTYASVISGRGSNTAHWEARYGLNNGTDTSAQYPCSAGVDLHQYTSMGSVPGIYNGQAGVDLNKITSDGKFNLEWYCGGKTTDNDKQSTVVETSDTIIVGSARWGESGGYNQIAGDQSGNEVSTQEFYVHELGWNILRCKDSSKAEKIANAMKKACANNCIGYDMGDRLTLYNWLKNKGTFDPSAVTDNVETDCSALVRVCVAYAGITASNFTTSNEASALVATGEFEQIAFTDKSQLRYGDILVTKTQGHTVVVLDGAPKQDGTSTTTVQKTVVIGKATAKCDMRIRRWATTDSTTMGFIKAGETIDIYDIDNGWYKILHNGYWAYTSNVDLKYYDYKPSWKATSSWMGAVVNCNALNVRTKPVTGDIIQTIPHDKSYAVCDGKKIDGTTWWLIHIFHVGYGWVSGKYIKRT